MKNDLNCEYIFKKTGRVQKLLTNPSKIKSEYKCINCGYTIFKSDQNFEEVFRLKKNENPDLNYNLAETIVSGISHRIWNKDFDLNNLEVSLGLTKEEYELYKNNPIRLVNYFNGMLCSIKRS